MGFLVIFIVGVGVGYIARRYGFCIFGAIVEALTIGSGRRLLAVFSAMLLFGIVVRLGTYQHYVEYAGLRHVAGGLLQGVGYYIAVGCPLSLLVRTGEGSKFHGVVIISFVLGVALYVGILGGTLENTFTKLSFTGAVTLTELW